MAYAPQVVDMEGDVIVIKTVSGRAIQAEHYVPNGPIRLPHDIFYQGHTYIIDSYKVMKDPMNIIVVEYAKVSIPIPDIDNIPAGTNIEQKGGNGR